MKLDSANLLKLDAHSLQERMREGSITAIDLLTSCLTQIETHDDGDAQLRAVISVAPRKLLRIERNSLTKSVLRGGSGATYTAFPFWSR